MPRIKWQRENEAGSVDAVVLLLFVAGLQILNFVVLLRMCGAWQRSMQSLAEAEEVQEIAEIQAFGESWKAPHPRIDYGAYYQRNRDAEALCIVGRAGLSAQEFAKLRCD